MTVTIELSEELEAGLAALAAARGLDMRDYVQHLLAEQVPARVRAGSSTLERAAAWRDVGGLPRTPPLSDAAISRDTMYGQRG